MASTECVTCGSNADQSESSGDRGTDKSSVENSSETKDSTNTGSFSSGAINLVGDGSVC